MAYVLLLCCSTFVAFVFLAVLFFEDFYDVRTTFKWFYGKYWMESIGAALSGSHIKHTVLYVCMFVYVCVLRL